MDDEGLEHAREYSIFADSNVCAAPGAARPPDSAPTDPDLADLIDAWQTLPEAIRADILTMVQQAQGNRSKEVIDGP